MEWKRQVRRSGARSVRARAMHRGYLFFKYSFDFCAALLAVILLSPLLLLVAIAIKAEDGGEIIFRQKRTGRGGKKFFCYKFRSMTSARVRYNKHRRVIGDENPNVTKVGRVIRKLKIDELPQLFNILKGDMSIIGPRPLLPVFDRDYEDWEMIKFELRPGLTGLGQVRGNGYLSLYDRKYYDAYYAMHASLGLDIGIFFRTLGVILFGEKKFLKPVSEAEHRFLRREVKRNYTVPPETRAALRAAE